MRAAVTEQHTERTAECRVGSVKFKLKVGLRRDITGEDNDDYIFYIINKKKLFSAIFLGIQWYINQALMDLWMNHSVKILRI